MSRSASFFLSARTSTSRCSILTLAVAGRATSTRLGSLRNLAASFWIGGGMVAENSKVWRDLRKLRADFLDVRDEAHVEHPVGFVDHQQVAVVEHDLAAAEQVHQPARRGDQHVDALFQRLDLVAHLHAADQQRHRERVVLAVFLEILGDLHARARASARGSASAAFAPGCGLRAGCRSSAGRSRRSCRCRSGRCRSGPCPSAPTGWRRAGSASARHSRCR